MYNIRKKNEVNILLGTFAEHKTPEQLVLPGCKDYMISRNELNFKKRLRENSPELFKIIYENNTEYLALKNHL